MTKSSGSTRVKQQRQDQVTRSFLDDLLRTDPSPEMQRRIHEVLREIDQREASQSRKLASA